MAQVLDLRGRQLAREPTPVLLDPSGGRARLLAWAGRGLAILFLIWLVGLVFAGLGLLPSSDLPFGRALVGQSPPTLKKLPPITQPAFAAPAGSASGTGTAGLTAGAAAAGASGVGGAGGSVSTGVAGRSGTGSALLAPVTHGHGHGPGTVPPGVGSGAANGNPGTGNPASTGQPSNGVHAGGSGPGRTVSQSSPGHTKSGSTTSTAGSGSTSSGHGHGTTTSTTSSTTPGKSGSAPGHAAAG